MKPTITIGHLPIIDHLILGVAQKNEGKYFNNLNLKTKLFENMDKAIADLTAKKIDGAFILFPLAIELFRQGNNIKIILLGQREGQVFVVSNKIKTLADLKNKTIQVPYRYSVHNILQFKILQQAGLDPFQDIHYRFGFEDINEFLEILKKGEIQGFISAEPMGTLAVKTKIGKIIATSHDVKTHHVCCVLVMRDEILDKYPEACQELVESLVKAGMFINAYPRQAAEIGENFIRYPRKIVLESLTHHRGHVLFWDLLPRLEDFTELQNIAVAEMKLWDKPINLKKLIYPVFAQNAYREWMIDVRQEVKDKGEERTLPGNFMEAVTRVQSALKRAVPVVGLRLIHAGEKYPKNTEQKEPALILEKHLWTKGFIIKGGHEGIKALHVFPPATPGVNPDRIIFILNKEEARRCYQALHFGEQIKIFKKLNRNRVDEELLYLTNASFLEQDEEIWCSLEYVSFKFLALLLNYF